MSRIAAVLRTITGSIAGVVGALARAVVTIATLPFRAIGKLFGGGNRQPR